MKVRCGNCGTVYNIKDELITEKPRKVRCSKCNHVFMVRRPSTPPAEQSSIPAQDQAPALGAMPGPEPTEPISKPEEPSPVTRDFSEPSEQPAPDQTSSDSLFSDGKVFADAPKPPTEQLQPPAESGFTKPLPVEPKPSTDTTAPPPAPSEAPPQEQTWKVKVEGEVFEDLDLMTMKKWIREGRLDPMNEVLSESGEWVIAADIPILMKYFRLKESMQILKGKSSVTTPTAALEFCTTHPNEIAKWRCSGCGRKFCPQCIRYQKYGVVEVPVCDKCDDRCEEIKASRTVKPFWAQIPQMLAYPFVKGGAIMTIIGFIISLLPYIGLIIYPYSLYILKSSAMGKDRMPDWPDFTDIYEDIVAPSLRFIVGSFVVFVPLAIYIFLKFKFLDWTDPSVFFKIIFDPINLVLIFFAWVYLPMVLIIVAIFNRLTPALNPVTVFKLINAIRKEYIIMLLLGLLFGVIDGIIGGMFGVIPILGRYIGKMVNWYFIIVNMRLLGMMVYQVEEKLGWD